MSEAEKPKRTNGDFTKRERDIREALFAVMPEDKIGHEELWEIADALIDELRKRTKWL